jgi:rare lipoprotein A
MKAKKTVAGTATRSNTALAIFAATLLIGGTATEASAKSKHHTHFHHVASHSVRQDANAATGEHGFTGIASMYGNESGRATASGQRFNEDLMTCAHRSLPFGTKLRVSHGGRSVVVTVNDRGPYVHGRVLDLSTGAARAIGLGGLGEITAKVVG